MKIAREGYPFIIIAGFLIIIPFLTDGYEWLAVIPILITLFMLYFFRDPERNIPQKSDVLVSPADGKIIVCDSVFEQEFLQSECRMISIFMSPLDVHINRMPCDCVIVDIRHKKGKFLSAFKPEASVVNESISIVIETSYGKILLRQVAGFVARRAVCRGKIGERYNRGERFGIIKFSSRVDIYLPHSIKETVSINQRVKAGESIIGELRH